MRYILFCIFLSINSYAKCVDFSGIYERAGASEAYKTYQLVQYGCERLDWINQIQGEGGQIVPVTTHQFNINYGFSMNKWYWATDTEYYSLKNGGLNNELLHYVYEKLPNGDIQFSWRYEWPNNQFGPWVSQIYYKK